MTKQKNVLFIAGNIIKLDANPIKIFDMLSRVIPLLDKTILLSFNEIALFKLGFKKKLAYQKFSTIKTEFKILPRIPFFMCIYTLFIIVSRKINIVHAVGHTATFLGAFLKFLTGVKLIGDFAGLVPDERILAGIWEKNSVKYKFSKFIEKKAIRRCDHIIVVSNTFKRYIEENYQYYTIEVIPSIVNEKRFFGDMDKRALMREKFNLTNKFVVVFSGSIAPWDLTKEIMEFFIKFKIKIPNSHFLILTKGKDKIQKLIKSSKLHDNDFTILSLSYEEVPDHLLMGDIGLLFRDDNLIHRAGSPMKFAEYLACGLPIIGSAGLGELIPYLSKYNIGTVIDFKTEMLNKDIDYLVKLIIDNSEEIRKRCENFAIQHFSYGRYLNRYIKLYTQ